MFFRSSATSGRAARGPRDGLVWNREGRKMAIGQYRSGISFDDVAQKTTLARSAHQNNSERTSKLLEEQCDEFVSLVSVRFQGLKTIDVIERNGLPKNSVALEPGDLEVDFVRFFPILLRTIFPFFRGGRRRVHRKIAWRSSLVTSRWTSYCFFPCFGGDSVQNQRTIVL